jgi:hypothetical protein
VSRPTKNPVQHKRLLDAIVRALWRHPPPAKHTLLSEGARAVVAGAYIDEVHPSERLGAAKEAARFWVESGQHVRPDVVDEIIVSHDKMERRQPKIKKDVELYRRKVTAVYAARYWGYEGIDVYRKAVNLLNGKIGIAGCSKKEVDTLQDWFERNEKDGTLPQYKKELFEKFIKDATPRS